MARKIDCSENIDPKRADIDATRKRRAGKPVVRKREGLAEAVKPWAEEAKRRKKHRPAQPGVMLEAQRENGHFQWAWASTLHDENTWLEMMADAFGTRSLYVINMFFDHLSDLCRDSYDRTNEAWKPSERQMNAAIAIIHASRPRDELDAMLCAQAVAVHWMQMRATANLIGGTSGYLDPASAKVCARLSETFVKQIEAIDRRKRKPRTVRQLITVKRETHIYNHQHGHLEGGMSADEGQGQVTGEGIIDAIDGAAIAKGRAALPRPCTHNGQTVPLSSSQGQEGVPPPRRGKGKRGANG